MFLVRNRNDGKPSKWHIQGIGNTGLKHTACSRYLRGRWETYNVYTGEYVRGPSAPFLAAGEKPNVSDICENCLRPDRAKRLLDQYPE